PQVRPDSENHPPMPEGIGTAPGPASEPKHVRTLEGPQPVVIGDPSLMHLDRFKASGENGTLYSDPSASCVYTLSPISQEAYQKIHLGVKKLYGFDPAYDWKLETWKPGVVSKYNESKCDEVHFPFIQECKRRMAKLS